MCHYTILRKGRSICYKSVCVSKIILTIQSQTQKSFRFPPLALNSKKNTKISEYIYKYGKYAPLH